MFLTWDSNYPQHKKIIKKSKGEVIGKKNACKKIKLNFFSDPHK